MERALDFGMNIGTAILAAIASGVAWLIRRVLTNQAEIGLLKQHIDARDKLREEDRQALMDVKESVRRIEGLMMERAK